MGKHTAKRGNGRKITWRWLWFTRHKDAAIVIQPVYLRRKCGPVSIRERDAKRRQRNAKRRITQKFSCQTQRASRRSLFGRRILALYGYLNIPNTLRRHGKRFSRRDVWIQTEIVKLAERIVGNE